MDTNTSNNEFEAQIISKKKNSKLNNKNTHQGTRVLIIDDDKDTADAIKFLIESYSHGSIKCTVANHSSEALLDLTDSAGENKYELLLVDHKIPIMTGVGILKAADAYLQTKTKIPVIMFSGNSDYKHSILKSNNLDNFEITGFLNKRDLPEFLKNTFTAPIAI